MKTKQAPDLPRIYRLLAKEIDRQIAGSEVVHSTAEVTQRGLTYIVEYEYKKEFNESHHRWDEEPSGSAIESLNIYSFGIYDNDGQEVTTTVDFFPEQIEDYFNTPDYTIDHRDER